MSKKDIQLKDKNGNQLYPLSHKDSDGNIFQQTYLKKNGLDSYISNARVEEYTDPSTGETKNKLILINVIDPSNPIEFYGGGKAPEPVKALAINKDINSDYNIDLDNFFDSLKPCKINVNNETHLGLLYNDIEQSLFDNNLNFKDFYGVEDNKNNLYLLDYNEFICLCIDQIQKLKNKVKELENAK